MLRLSQKYIIWNWVLGTTLSDAFKIKSIIKQWKLSLEEIEQQSLFSLLCRSSFSVHTALCLIPLFHLYVTHLLNSH